MRGVCLTATDAIAIHNSRGGRNGQNSLRGASSECAIARDTRQLFALPNASRFTRVRVLFRLYTGRHVQSRGAAFAAGTRRDITDRRLGKMASVSASLE